MESTQVDKSGSEPDRVDDTANAALNDTGSRNSGRKNLLYIALLAATTTLLGGFFWWLHARNYVSTDDAFIDAQVVRIAPQVAGVVSELTVQPNEHVAAGALLAVIAPDTVLPQIARQEADVVNARARAGSTRADIRNAEAARQRASAAVAEAEAQFDNAKNNLARLSSSRDLNRSSVSTSDMDVAQTTLKIAQARLVSARGDVEAANAQLTSAQQAVRSADAATRAAQAQADEGQVSLDQTRIAAPMAGSIANISINRGSYVAPGMQMMALVPNDLWVTANFKETQLQDIHIGDPVEISIDAFPGRSFAGRVDSIQRASGSEFQLLPAQNATGNFVKVVQRVPVRITFTEQLPPELAIGPGMSVVPTIKIK